MRYNNYNHYSSTRVYGLSSIIKNICYHFFILTLVLVGMFGISKSTVAEEDGGRIEEERSTSTTPSDDSTPVINTGVLEPGEAPSIYTVEEGDTLYDICDQLIDNSDYWPKLWSLNPDIKNPHFIEAGTQLRFYPDDRMNPEMVAVADADDIVPTDNSLLEEEEMYPDRMDHLLAHNEAQYDKDFIDLKDVNGSFESNFENYGFIHDPTKFTAVVPAFIFEEEPFILGNVVTGLNNEQLGYEGNDFVVETKNDDIKLEVNSTYTVVRVSQKLYRKKDDTNIGQRYDFVAHIRVNEILKYSDSDADTFYKADIVFSNLGLQPNDIVIPYKSAFKHYNVENKVEVYNDMDAAVVDLEFVDKSYSGVGDIVFIDKKLDVGKYFPVYHSINVNRGIGFVNGIPDIQSRVAVVKIISNEENSSSGVIVDSSSIVQKGDVLGKLARKVD